MQEQDTDDEVLSEPTVTSGVGHWLQEARKDKDLTAEAVAQALHLDIEIIQALESESFDALGAPVFAKGHLRAVANYLGLNADEAARRFHDSSGLAEDSQPELIVSYHSKPPKDRRWIIGVVLLVLFVLVGALGWALWSLRADTDDGSTLDTADEVQSSTPLSKPEEPAADAAASDRVASSDSDFAARLAAAEAQAEVASPTTTEPEPVTATPTAVPQSSRPVATSGSVELRFSESCWYEVRDANGTRVAYGTAQPGLVRRLDGQRPLNVVLGVADAVSITVDGSEFVITPAMRRGRTARFEIP